MHPATHSVLRTALLSLIALHPGSAKAPASHAQRSERLYTTEHTAMATRWQLLLYTADPQRAEELSDQVFGEVDRLEALLSNYRPQSELSRINAEAAHGTVTTDPETFDFLSQAQHWSEESDGAFDMTVGPLMKAWGFFRKAGQQPSHGELQSLRGRVGWQNVELDRPTRGVRFRVAGVELDPGGIGKGFAVDAALRLLRAEGVDAAMLSAGSSTLGALGAPLGLPGWRVHLHDPWNPAHDVSTAMLRDATLSTANCAEKNFTLQGHLYCHIMDPHTLRPVDGVQQVTIVDPSGTASDALSNALFVLPVPGSERLLQHLPADRALIVTGPQDHRVCTAIRWRDPIAPGFCARIAEVP